MSQFKNQLSDLSIKALQLLISGNQRFVKGIHSVEMNFSRERLKELAEKGQSPFSIVLTCSDSRVPVETIFDMGLGATFVIRVAGNVISSDVIASVEYAAEQFRSPLCVVMGHTGCGAVQAAVQYFESGKCTLSASGRKLLKKILPSVKKARRLSRHSHDTYLPLAILTNVRTNKSLLTKKSKVISNLISQKKLAIVGAIYDIQTGKVTFDQANQGHSTLELESMDPGSKDVILAS